jgi:hypothetical protein
MIISHETPLCLLHESEKFNDYDYALVHLFDKYPTYHQYFIDMLRKGRRVILDNSVFELGTAWDMHEFVDRVIDLGPTEYIIPDVFDDHDQTLANAERWFKDYRKEISHFKSIGVAHGRTLAELYDCYIKMGQMCNKVAIPYHSAAFQEVPPSQYFESTLRHTIGKDEALALGRRYFLTMLANRGELVNTHLLGGTLPSEFSYYHKTNMSAIVSIDTSLPIAHAIEGVAYDPDRGTVKKSSVKIDKVFDIDHVDYDLVYWNVSCFRLIATGKLTYYKPEMRAKQQLKGFINEDVDGTTKVPL